MNSTDNIHRRYRHLFTLPSVYILALFTYFTSALIVFTANVVSAVPLSSMIFSMVLALPLLSITLFTENLLLKTNPLTNLRRLFFLSFASNILWLLVLAIGLPFTLKSAALGKYTSILILGIFVTTSFRLVIVKTLFLNEFYKALPMAFAQPMLIGLAASYPSLLPYLSQQHSAYIGGIIFVASTIAFMILLEKPGEEFFKERPSKFTRAFLLAWLAHHPDEFEKIVEKTSPNAVVKTTVLSFEDQSPKPALIVTDAHPGPFYPVGSSNLPYVLHEWFINHGYSPMVLHSVSGHELNLPSKGEVQHFLSSLNFLNPVTSTGTCTTPITQTTGKATVMGITFNDTVLLALTLSPGTEDFPKEVRERIEKLTFFAGFKNVIIIDSHNSQGEKPSANDYNDVCEATNQVLMKLRASVQNSFKVGFSHSSEFNFPFKDDVGPAGIGVLLLEVNGRMSALVGVDANNARLGLREALIESSKRSDAPIIELCTSDTHITTSGEGGVSKGYYALGELTDGNTLINAIQAIKERAINRLSKAGLTIKVANAAVKVMGVKALDDFSLGLDKSLSFAKKGALTLIAIFLLTLILVSLV